MLETRIKVARETGPSWFGCRLAAVNETPPGAVVVGVTE